MLIMCHGFCCNLSNKLVYSKLKNIDDEGFMRAEKVVQNKNVRQVSYSDAHW